MGNLADQLAKAGVASEKDIAKAQRLQREREQTALAQNVHRLASNHGRSGDVTLETLQAAQTITEFKDVAGKLLLKHPGLNRDVVADAQRFKDVDGGKKLIWLTLSVRDQLPGIDHREREAFLKRAFRRRGATPEPPTKPKGKSPKHLGGDWV
jgi:hypothetical protein